MDIGVLNKELEVTESPGLDITDPRFTDITGLAQDGEYEAAAAQAEAILQAEVYDVRVIGYFLYGVFCEHGIAALADIFNSAALLLDQNWEALGPVKHREKAAEASLLWFVKILDKKLLHEEERNSPLYQRWTEQTSSADVLDVLDAFEAFQRSLSRLEDLAGPIAEILAKIQPWLKNFWKLISEEPAGEAAEDEGEEPAEESAPPPASLDVDAGQLGGSVHLTLLLKKLRAFERLIEDSQYSRAALVADDVNEIISNFDPRQYFPRLFASFSRLQAENIGELLEYMEQRDSPEWQAMVAFYQTDLDGFVND